MCTNNKLSEKKETIQYKIASNTIKHLRINLAKEVKNLYTENFKSLVRDIEKDINIKVFHVCGLEKICIVKMSIQTIYRFSAITIKVPVMFLQK